MTYPSTNQKFNKELLQILVCPLTKKKLTYDKKNNTLVSVLAKLSYPIKNGIPILIIEKSTKI